MVETDFKRALLEARDANESSLVFALDLSADLFAYQNRDRRSAKRESLFNRASNLLDQAAPHLAAVKINYPLVLALGPELTGELLSNCDIPAIGDFKVADIDNTCKWIARHGFGMGFDAIIAHAFVGFEGGLQGLFQVAQEKGRGVILVINMSHPGSRQFITPQAGELTSFAVQQEADGVIAPATRPEEVRSARNQLGPNTLMLTPGIGAQGGKPGDAVAAGADLEIVGRGIYQAEEPGRAAKKIKEQISETAG
ncbi:MAG: orotidine-5'-phosphate decarboxylase [Candidatus Bipolaricaulota bacterium]